MKLFTDQMTRTEIDTEIGNANTVLHFFYKGTLKLSPEEVQETKELLDDLHRALELGEYRPEEVQHAVN